MTDLVFMTQTLGNGNMSVGQSTLERPFLHTNCTSEQRQEKLSRYRNKKTRRNFGRKIKVYIYIEWLTLYAICKISKSPFSAFETILNSVSNNVTWFQYACRKALADSQPRIRGRFAKTEELDVKRQ